MAFECYGKFKYFSIYIEMLCIQAFEKNQHFLLLFFFKEKSKCIDRNAIPRQECNGIRKANFPN